MEPSDFKTAAPAIQVPTIDTDEPVAVIPVASVAPLDGPPDGERINTFAVTPKQSYPPSAEWGSSARRRILDKPLTSLAAAFSLGFILARALR